ncbi:MAG: hypothetical protein LUQ14_02370 [Methanomassiliicoccales archaeon]|nr:hypothetical protein [Methanomassiliicoccales archaeon]
MSGQGLPPTYLLQRHPRVPKWKGAYFNPLKCTPAERMFTVLKGNGSSVGDLVFSEFKKKTATALSPWGSATITSRSLIGTKYEFLLGGISEARFVYNMPRSKMRIELANGQTFSFHRTKLLWRMDAETEYGPASLNLDGTIAPSGERVWELDRKTSKSLQKEVMAARPEQIGMLKRPKDPSIRHESIEEPYFLQWSISLPNALEKNNQFVAAIATLLSFKFLLLEIPQG